MPYNVDKIIFPQDFKYIEVIKVGKPTHQKYDSFYLKHPPMKLSKRAKIFSPFDALKGFDEAVQSKEVLYVPKKELNEDEMRELNIQLNTLHNLTANSKLARENNIHAEITYFVPCMDIENENYLVKGSYVTVSGIVKKVDPIINKIIIIEDIKILIEDILYIYYTDIDN
ncbi:MAG: hypothetical protein IJ232_09155 [Lachnospiraceae bacterium]|nr:hypothetical protein [Lachnospiraceae bacterium]